MCDCEFLPDIYRLNLISFVLITHFQINAGFDRITTVPLQSKFLSQLDLHSGNLMKLFQKRGQLGQRLKKVVAQMADLSDTVGM